MGGNAMAGGNFAKTLVIRRGRISPAGVLGVVEGERPAKLYAWVFQLNDDGSGAAVIAFQDETGFDASGAQWTTRDDAVHHGQLRSGPAVGMALTVSTLDEKTKVHWWSEAIELIEEDQPPTQS
jgi:hypothetical protein